MTKNREEFQLKLAAETARIGWSELERYFAKGVLWQVDAEQDLIEVAVEMAMNNEQQIKQWMNEGFIAELDIATAKDWQKNDPDLWAVVMAPWVLVQLDTGKKRTNA